MLKAILRNGSIVPLDPLPSDWKEGTPLEVGRAEPAELDIDQWAQEMRLLCADSLPEEEQRMQAAIAEHRRLAKAQARREMGLPDDPLLAGHQSSE
jgi:hypothetical protein